jgi:hypothetical protein
MLSSKRYVYIGQVCDVKISQVEMVCKPVLKFEGKNTFESKAMEGQEGKSMVKSKEQLLTQKYPHIFLGIMKPDWYLKRGHSHLRSGLHLALCSQKSRLESRLMIRSQKAI